MSKKKNFALIAGSTIVLLALSGGIFALNAGSLFDDGPDGGTFVSKAIEKTKPETREWTETLTVDELTSSDKKLIGMFSPNSPWNSAEIDEYTTAAGVAPNTLSMFTKWDSPFRADAADKAYQRGAVPVVSWEAWAKQSTSNDPAYTLENITSGKYDEYLRTFASDVADYSKPIMLRLNHEMNGSWYPWGVGVNGNTAAGYQASWRHVHDIFEEEGADNVAWIWSVNVVRAIPNETVPLAGLYPGDEYVDYVGVTGYSVGEVSAYDLYQPTVDVVRTFTAKPVYLSEIGAKPYAGKAGFISSLFKYVNDRPDVAGFVWFQTTKKTGGTGDWMLNDTPESIAAYRAGAGATPLTEVTRQVSKEFPKGAERTPTPLEIPAP